MSVRRGDPPGRDRMRRTNRASRPARARPRRLHRWAWAASGPDRAERICPVHGRLLLCAVLTLLLLSEVWL